MDKKIDIRLPKNWLELSQEQLRYVFFLLSEQYDFVQIKTFCFFRWADIKILKFIQQEHQAFVQIDKKVYILKSVQIEKMIHHLDFLENIAPYPVRLEKIEKSKAVPGDLTNVPFSNYLICENYYQGYLQTKKTEMLVEIAKILYNNKKIKLQPEEKVSVFYWFASLKKHYQQRFSELFTTTNNTDENNLLATTDIGKQLQTSMDNQIRALTKGDVTKEKEVLQTDTIRALTELNALAREYQEMQKEFQKAKK